MPLTITQGGARIGKRADARRAFIGFGRRAALVIVAALATSLLAPPPQSHALTVRERHDDNLVVSGAGCGTVARTVTLPASVRTTRLLSPSRGQTVSVDSDAGEQQIAIQSARVSRASRRRSIELTAALVSPCTTGEDAVPTPWEIDLQIVARVTKRVRVFFPHSCCDDRHDERPSFLGLGASFGLDNVRWASWGGRRARGTATVPFNDCVPYCAAGTVTPIPATVRLTRPRRCNGVYQYLTVTYTMLRRPPGGGARRGRSNFGFRCE